MTAEYEAALNEVREATKVYKAAVASYHSKAIGDDEFLAARSSYYAADAKFEAAFAKEQAA